MMDDTLEPAIYGPMIEYREYSFLDNKRLPAAISQSKVKVVLCKPGDASAACADGTVPAAEVGGVVHLRPDLTDVELTIALRVCSWVYG